MLDVELGTLIRKLNNYLQENNKRILTLAFTFPKAIDKQTDYEIETVSCF